MAGAAIFHEEAEQSAETVIVGGVDERAEFSLLVDEAGALQLPEMKGDVRGRDFCLLGNRPRGLQHPNDVQSVSCDSAAKEIGARLRLYFHNP